MRLSGAVRLRPVRIGFLVSPDDVKTVRRTMRLSCCLWGGRYNPLIPYFEDPPERWRVSHRAMSGLDIARGYINFFEPDVLVEAQDGIASSLGWQDQKLAFDLPRVISLKDFFEINSRSRVEFAAGLDIFNVIACLYQKDFRYERRRKEPFATFKGSDEPFFDVVGGSYPEDDCFQYIREAYQDVFEPEELSATADSYTKFLDGEFGSPRWVTTYQIEQSLGRGSDPTFFIFDPHDGQDLIDCWNFHLIEDRVTPINVRWLPDHGKLVRESIEATHRPIPDNPFGTKFHTVLAIGRSISNDRTTEIRTTYFNDLPDLSFVLSGQPQFWRPAETFPKLMRRPVRRLITAASEPFDAEVFLDGSERALKIPSPSPSFEKDGQLHTSAHWINVIQPSVDRDIGPATVYPTNLWAPDFPHLHRAPHVTITREGWVLPQRLSIGYSLLYPESGRDAIVGWLKHVGIDAKPSEAGQVAMQIIQASGSLLACGMFAEKQTIELLNGMAESQSESTRSGIKKQRTEPDRARHRSFVRQHFDARQKRSFGFWNKLDYFLERSVFRAGLRIRCPNCAYQNWFDLKTLDYSLNCGRCLKDFKFNESPAELGKSEWYYRVIGPFSTPDYGRGGYAVALTLRTISRFHHTEITWAAGLELSAPKCEVDFIAWHRRQSLLSTEERDEPKLVIGEAKSFGKNAITDEAVETLRKVGDRFPGAILVFSTLKDIEDYSSEELERLRCLSQWGRRPDRHGNPRNPLIVLTGRELFSQHGIEHAWKEAGGKAKELATPAYVDLDDLTVLSEMTQRLYLGLDSFHEDVIRNAQRKRLISLLKARTH